MRPYYECGEAHFVNLNFDNTISENNEGVGHGGEQWNLLRTPQ